MTKSESNITRTRERRKDERRWEKELWSDRTGKRHGTPGIMTRPAFCDDGRLYGKLVIYHSSSGSWNCRDLQLSSSCHGRWSAREAAVVSRGDKELETQDSQAGVVGRSGGAPEEPVGGERLGARDPGQPGRSCW
jgi:hypothetical protein